MAVLAGRSFFQHRTPTFPVGSNGGKISATYLDHIYIIKEGGGEGHPFFRKQFFLKNPVYTSIGQQLLMVGGKFTVRLSHPSLPEGLQS